MAINTNSLLPKSKIITINLTPTTTKKVKEIHKNVINLNVFFKKKLEDEKNKIKSDYITAQKEKRDKYNPTDKQNKGIFGSIASKLPSFGIRDAINRFIFFTFLGYAIPKLMENLPKMVGIVKAISGATSFIAEFTGNVFKGIVNFIDWGYKLADKTKQFLDDLKNQKYKDAFDKFISSFDKLLGVALTVGAGVAAKRTISGPTQKNINQAQQANVKQTPQENVNQNPKNTIPIKGKAPKLTKFGKFGKFAGKAAGKVPIIGGLVNFIFAMMSGDPIGRAAARSVGTMIGGGIGVFIPIPGIGSLIGSILGDIVGGALYDSLSNMSKPRKFKSGGQITRGGKPIGGPIRRTIKKRKKTNIRPQKQRFVKTDPGKDIGGKMKIESLFQNPKDNDIRNPLRSLTSTSKTLKKIPLFGGLMGASVDLSMGQKPNQNIYRNIANNFGFFVQNAIDSEMNVKMNEVSNQIRAMATGGIVPRTMPTVSSTIGEKIGQTIANTFSVMLNQRTTEIFQNIRKELALKEASVSGATPEMGESGIDFSISSDNPDFWLLATIAAYESANPQGASDVAQSIYNRMGYGQNGGNIRNIILAENQYQPVGDYGTASNWNKINSKETALEHIKKYPGNGVSQSKLESSAEAILNESMRKNSADFIGSRPDFRSEEYELKKNEMTQDITRNKQTFGFNNPSAYLGIRTKAFEIPKFVEGKVTRLSGGKGNLIWPTKGEVSSSYGWRWNRMHWGLDIANDTGTPIYAAKGGEVTISEWRDGIGNLVEIAHPDGSFTRYGHNSKLKVRKGQKVSQGQVISLMGSTGRSTGPHLHFEYYPPGQGAVDPLKFLPQGKNGRGPISSTNISKPQTADLAKANPTKDSNQIIASNHETINQNITKIIKKSPISQTNTIANSGNISRYADYNTPQTSIIIARQLVPYPIT